MRCETCRKITLAHDRRGAVDRCFPCDQAYIAAQKIDKGQSELRLTPSNDPEPIAAVLESPEIVTLIVRVPETCSQCGSVEGPDATRVDQVFERYGRLLCRQCRKNNRNGTRRRRRSRRGERDATL